MTPQERNHPKKGDSTLVDPIRSLGDIREIKDFLKRSPRNYALFVVGINFNLRASDLVRLTVGQFRDLSPGGQITIKVKKTQRLIILTVNKTVLDAVQPLLTGDDSLPLFKSAKTGGTLEVSSVHNMVQDWCRKCGAKGKYGSHSLRKTWAYHQIFTFGAKEEVVSEALGHKSVRETRRYLGIQQEDVQTLFMHEL